MKTKILLFDIETAPNLSYTWGKWEQDVIEFERDWYVLSYAAKWLGEDKVIVKGLPDFKSYKKDKENDRELVESLWKLLDEADIVIAHNGDEFDIKKINARFITHGMNPPSPYIKLDTKKMVKRYFRFDSNKLNDLGKYLGLGEKIETGGFKLWKGCMQGEKNSWKTMLKYNKQDVILLEKVYLKLRSWTDNHPNINVLTEKQGCCPMCGSDKLQKRGFSITRISRKQRYQCQKCGAWSTSGSEKILDIR